MKTAIITGISGQDGAYLSRYLLDKNYKIIGIVRSQHQKNIQKLSYLKIEKDIIFEECDLTDITHIIQILENYKPDEVYNLAAQSSVGISFQQPISTITFNTASVINILEAIKLVNNKIRFYQASSSEMYGKINALPINEQTKYNPISPYGVSKANAHLIVSYYRNSEGLFASSGILFNHESFLRDQNFFCKKLISEAIRIRNKESDYIEVGNISIKRDFGYSAEYVKAMWRILQHAEPDDFIICSGKSILLADIIKHVFNRFSLSNENLKVNKKLYRPNEIEDIYGDNSKAKKLLNWNYDMDFYDVLDIIIQEELDYMNRNKK